MRVCENCKKTELSDPQQRTCFDCTYPTPEARNRAATIMQWNAKNAHRTLRDQFVMAVYEQAYANVIGITGPGHFSHAAVAQEAYAMAEALMKTRQERLELERSNE